MNHLKKFENFYLNNNHLEDDTDDTELDDQRYLDKVRRNSDDFECDPDIDPDCEEEEDGEEEDIRRRVWGDEVIEEKKKSMKKDVFKLTDRQKKLPKALQDSILKRMKKRS